MNYRNPRLLVTHDPILVTILLRLFMKGPLVIARAEFGIFYASRLLALILRCRIITHFAFRTFERYDVSHKSFSFKILSF